MPQLKTFLVVNPKSAGGATGKKFGDISSVVRNAVGEFAHAFTTKPMEAASLARKALKEGYECVVAVGGDGTINEVVNGFFEDDAPVKPGAVLGVIPRGTGGDFRKAFGWSTDLKEAAERLRGDKSLPLDVGRVRFVSNEGQPATRYFANIASAGASGQVDAEVNKSSKALGGKLSFMLASAKAMASYHDRQVKLTLDDGPAKNVMVTTLAVANGQYFGGGMWVAPHSKCDDGMFDVTLWTGYKLLDFVTKGQAIYKGTHINLPGTQCFRAKKVVAESSETVLLDIDGEQPGRLPATFEILPCALRIKA